MSLEQQRKKKEKSRISLCMEVRRVKVVLLDETH